jgi:hypothetical protein
MAIPAHARPFLAAALLLLGAVPAAAQGAWRVEFPPAKDPVHAHMREAMQDDPAIHDMTGPLDQSFPLERDVVIEIAECGLPRSYYTPTRPAVRVCYELILWMAETATAEGLDDNAMGDAIGFILLHGVARAAIDQLAIPISLPPQIAADELAAYMLTADGGQGESTLRGLSMLSGHALDWERGAPFTPARAENVFCLLYGADPRKNAWAVAEGLLPTERAAGCAEEFRQVGEYWELTLGEILEG